jgi:hypothetical protein
VDAILERSYALKQAITDFVLDAEGDIAQALETFAAQQSRRSSNDVPQDFVIDSFICEGIGDLSPLNEFIQNSTDLSESDRLILQSWENSFVGLFAILKILPDGFELMNWLTDKHYIVKPNTPQLQEMSRLKENEIILTRIAPVTEDYWMLFSSYVQMGKLGKPKLAVAIGNFKDNYKQHIYSDAPELLEEAWQSVEHYHQEFINYFGADEITLPGYQLNKKITELQEILTQKRLEEAGIDPSKSLAEVVQEAGVGEEEIQEAVAELGADATVVSQMLKNKNPASKMMMPKVDLPAELKKAEQVTTLSHPRWGQMFLPNYSKIKNILEAEDWQSVEGVEKLIRQSLEDKSVSTFVWYRLAAQYPTQLEKVLQTVLQRPFQLETDFNSLLQEFNKPIEPDLPEIASVPLHLHNLFQEAVAEVSKSKPKGKAQKQSAKGFQ